MKNPEKLPNDVSALLNARLQDEYDALLFYRAASNWCENSGYHAASVYFADEAKSEAEHARGLEEYMSGWNVTAKLPSVDAPGTSFAGLADVIEQAYGIEYDLYESYEKDSLTILAAKDTCTFDFLGKYRTIQRESVKELSDMLNELKAIGSTDRFALFYWQSERFEQD